MAKSVDGDSAFASTSRFDTKRSQQWFLDADAPELFPNKKQSVLTLNSTSSLGLSHANAPSWDNASGYQPVPNPFINRLFESETRSFSFEERNAGSVENVTLSASLGLPVSHGLEDPEAFLGYGGFRKVKVNQIKEPDNSVHALNGQSFATQSSNEISTIQSFDRDTGNSFMDIGQGYNQQVNTVTLTSHIFDGGDTYAVPTCSTYIKEDLNTSQLDECATKEATHMISFTDFHGEHNLMPVSRSIKSYDQTYLEDKVSENELGASNASAVVGITQAVKSKSVSASKNKSESKSTKKEAPNSFPSNVRSLISTGMLDRVPVKYVSVSREELRGTIKGSGYLCGCQSCNHSKVLNAYEFERHAGCKTKHPNNHIYFENGKTIYQIVQELRSTPESMLFDVIQNVFGAPINQKAFRTWKESYQAATRELQRIYGKEELNF